jgi:hypothetical protein
MTQEQTKSVEDTLQPFLKGIQVGDALGHANLTVIPLRRPKASGLDYLLAAEAIKASWLAVTEVSESGSVPELLATNNAEKPVLLLDGEELVGAKQNRILNTTVLLAAHSKTKIPVSCVEQGRWHSMSAPFFSGHHSPSGLRARKSRDVSRSLAAVGEARSDQGAVWESVGDQLQSVGACSPTSSMHDAYEQRADLLLAYVGALKYPVGSAGVVVAIEGRFVAIDLFNRADSLEQIWTRLVTGYAMDALSRRSADKTEPSERLTARGASVLLEHLAEIPCVPRPTVGLGEDWRFEDQGVLGQALVVPAPEAQTDEGAGSRVCVHLCAFPNENHGRQESDGPAILPPSRRRGRTS